MYFFLFCIVAKYKRVTLARSQDSLCERELLLFTIVGADVNVDHKVAD